MPIEEVLGALHAGAPLQAASPGAAESRRLASSRRPVASIGRPARSNPCGGIPE
jgi:hypothetical protein